MKYKTRKYKLKELDLRVKGTIYKNERNDSTTGVNK